LVEAKHGFTAYATTGFVVADPRRLAPSSQLPQNVVYALQARTARHPGAKELQKAAAAVVKRCEGLELRTHNPRAEVA
jgi:hypothetical protein